MTEKLPCGECGLLKQVTTAGLIYKHGNCPGGGMTPLTQEHVDQFVDTLATSRKTGFTDEQLERMLSDLTPKRQKLWERLQRFLHWGR